ncbi:MAG TPA: HAD family phosphatase [Nocardioides sp.]|uniref:HAD family hydrolase n=1 Tax=Nocardioides sp. TaxID=35761 RepID=UPI002ED7917B
MPRREPVLGATCAVRAVLLDADGNLFPSEEPAFAASTRVTNDLLARLGSGRRWEADELRRAALGRNFRALAGDFARDLGVALGDEELEEWVAREQRAVTRHLAEVLRPDPRVSGALERLGERFELIVVSSSALVRLAACVRATALDMLLPPGDHVSAQDSLALPTSKPDPAVYRLALERLGLEPGEALAVEDAAAGVRSAVGAGIRTIGNVCFVPPPERAERAAELRAAGAFAVTASWAGVVELIEATAACGPVGDPAEPGIAEEVRA